MPRSRFYTPRPITLVPGVTHRQVDSRTDAYAGSAEALEAAGVLTADMLPAPTKCSMTWAPTGPIKGWTCYAPGYVRIVRHPAGGYRVYVTVSLEEQDRRSEAARAKAEDRARQAGEWDQGHWYATPESQERRKQEQRARLELQLMPASHEHYRREVTRQLSSAMASYVKHLLRPQEFHGYSFEPAVIEEFIVAFADEALSILADGATQFNAARHHARVTKLKATIAAADGGFKRFLERCTADAD